ncbi:MAG: HAD family hydrolase [Candidatus Hodarchaeales archaeon]|jgi:HAD superfamily hydrolase (TIGR01549 family)
MNSFDIVSLDLFNTLVFIDRKAFNGRVVLGETLRNFPDLIQKMPQIPIDSIVNDYYTIIRQNMNDVKTEEEFNNEEVLIDVFKKHSVEITPKLSEFVHQVMTSYFETALPLIQLYPGISETLDYLKEKDYTLVLTSNHSWAQNGWDILHKHELEEYFDRVIFSGDIGYKKPSPKIFSTALSGLSFRSKEHIIHIGDDFEADIIGALKFGIKATWIRLPHKSSPDVKEIDDLEGIISSLNEITQFL